MASPKARSHDPLPPLRELHPSLRVSTPAQVGALRVLTLAPASMAFAPPDHSLTSASQPRLTQRPLVAVGPGRPASATPIHGPVGPIDVTDFPVQQSKVKSPPLRDETLARGRLLEWLEAKIHHRLVLITAEAGYGKTTLLADFSRRTRLRTLWYRLDETDRDWVTVLHHLVAAGRVVDPEFGACNSIASG